MDLRNCSSTEGHLWLAIIFIARFGQLVLLILVAWVPYEAYRINTTSCTCMFRDKTSPSLLAIANNTDIEQYTEPMTEAVRIKSFLCND